MPQCSHCQTVYEKGQRYCSVCGSFLLHPEEGDTFCPQCGVRVSPRQEFCHECDAPIKGEGLKQVEAALVKAIPVEAAPKPPPAPAAAPPGIPSWVIGALAAAGILVIILLIVVFSRTSPPPAPPSPPPQVQAPTTPAPAPAVTPAPPVPPPAAPAEGLQDQLQKVLSTLRDAQLKKNVTEFMSVYSATLPNYDQKRTDALSAWEDFDYANLVFTVDKVQAIDANNALASVTWYMDIRNRSNQELSSATQTYQVRFVQEMGQWRIRELKEVQ
jgi:hypothetical protein